VGTITLIDDGTHLDLEGEAVDDRLLVEPDAFAAATGWVLKPEGLCRDDVCVPVRDRVGLTDASGRIDVERVATALGRPVVVEAEHAVAALGTPAAGVAEQLRTLQAPPLVLPDLEGNPVDVHDLGRRKRLLLAWSSW
jgi:hypothetical protein